MTAVPAGFPLPNEKDLRRRYGLDLDAYVALAELQGWVCAICGKPPKANRPLVVDHNHDTLEIDGLVHLIPCNRRLTQPVRRYLADPPGRHLGLRVPAELEAKTITRREAGKAAARATRATKRATRAKTRPVAPSTLNKIRAMTRPEDDFATRVQRALRDTG
jgi:hypothetical protein